MPLVNDATKTIGYKIVYEGPRLSGKTTNLKYIHSQIAMESKSELIRDTDFMYFALRTPGQDDRGFTTYYALYTAMRSASEEQKRKLLKECDGIVFVADSDQRRTLDNLDALVELIDRYQARDSYLNLYPWVLQYNKRDLVNLASYDELESQLNRYGVPAFETVATDGLGVFDTLKAISKLVENRTATLLHS